MKKTVWNICFNSHNFFKKTFAFYFNFSFFLKTEKKNNFVAKEFTFKTKKAKKSISTIKEKPKKKIMFTFSEDLFVLYVGVIGGNHPLDFCNPALEHCWRLGIIIIISISQSLFFHFYFVLLWLWELIFWVSQKLLEI